MNMSTPAPYRLVLLLNEEDPNVPVAGFTSSDISVNGGTVSNFSSSGGGGHTYTFNVTPTTFPSTVTVTIPKGSAAGGGGVYENDVVSKSVFCILPYFFCS